MTGEPLRLTISNQAWKKDEVKKKWRSILAVFITITIFFAIANGLVKSFSFKDKLNKSTWDGISSFTIAIDSTNPSVFIYQPDHKRVSILTISGETFYETGNLNLPLVKISDTISNSSQDLIAALSHAYHSKIDNYISLSEKMSMNEISAKEVFLDFASITTPVKLITSGWGNNLKDTNITRLDAIRLWWQVKGLSANSLEFIDLAEYTEEINRKNNQRVLGADSASLNRAIAKYTENLKVLEEKYNIEITNTTNSIEAVQLASDFVKSIGGNVVKTSQLESSQDVNAILTDNKNSYTARYLANIFDCGITETKTELDFGEITIILGDNFAKNYFE